MKKKIPTYANILRNCADLLDKDFKKNKNLVLKECIFICCEFVDAHPLPEHQIRRVRKQ